MKKTLRKTLKITGIVLLVLVAAAFLIPVIFKKQITTLVKNEINKSITAKVDFKDVSLSLFRHFPKISIALEELTVIGTNEFAKDTLISTKTLDASVNLLSAIKGKDIKIYGVFLQSPRIHALVNKEGKANWDIAKDDGDTTTTDSSPSEFKMNLEEYKISNGYVFYKDEQADMSSEIFGLDHEGSGDFTSAIFTLSTKTKADAASFTYASIPYLSQTKTDIITDIKIDNSTNTYTFKTEDISVNALKLNAEGFFQLVNDSTYNMDIKFKTPSNEFKDILSMIPAIYKQDFDKIKTGGNAAFNGFVKGTYSPQQMPAYDVKLEVKDGSFQYPDLKPVKNIQLELHANNPDGKPDNAVVDISKGYAEMDSEPFDFRVLFRNPETVQFIDAAIKGKLDLANLSKFIKLEKDTKLAGLVWADAFAKGNMSALQAQQGDFTAGGFFDVKNLFYSSPAFPQPIQNGNIKATIENSGGIADNTSINISSGHIEVGKDPLDFTLKLLKPMSTVDFSGTAKGRFTLDNIKQFTTPEAGTIISGILNSDLSFSGNKAAIDKKEYDKIAVNGRAGLNNLKYVSKDYPTGIIVSNAELGFDQKTVTVKNLNGNYLNTNFSGNGVLNNLVGFAMQDQPLKGTVNVTADKMNLNDWMGTDTTTSTSSASAPAPAPFIVPANIDLTINTKADKVKYDRVEYNKINGTLLLADETIKLQNVRTEALDGTMNFNGSYSTKANKKDPAISINYDVKDLDVQKTFYAYNTIQKLMPIGQFLAGKLQSQLTMTGNLNGNMLPDLNTLSGKGNLLLIEGLLKKFAPLEKLANALQIDHLKSITLRDVKQFIEFANGKVLVKPFNVKISDIEMQIGGLHGFDQSIDYIIEMKVPRKYLGNEGNNLVNGLIAQATSKGIPVRLSDMIDLSVKMGGSITNPSIKIDLQTVVGDAADELKEQAKDFAQQKIDSAKARAKDTLNIVKEKLEDKAKEKLLEQVFGKDTTKTINPADSSKKKNDAALKDKLKSIFIKPKKPATDTTKKN
jgi:AsmA-like C-terminal region